MAYSLRCLRPQPNAPTGRCYLVRLGLNRKCAFEYGKPLERLYRCRIIANSCNLWRCYERKRPYRRCED